MTASGTPVYLTTGAYVLYAAFAAGAVRAFTRGWRKSRDRRRRELLEKLATDMHTVAHRPE